MRVMVCELPDERRAFDEQWPRLVEQVRESGSELVLLPDMAFCKWFADDSSRPDPAVWRAAVRAHDEWESRLSELHPAMVLGTRPVDFGNERYDEGFVCDATCGMRSVHAKAHVANEEVAQSWYQDATTPDFTPLELPGVRIGFLIGAEVLVEAEARRYGEEGVHVLAMPRCTAMEVFDDWLVQACVAASRAHAYGLSSNRSGRFGGQSCIIAPDGRVLGITNASHPFLPLDLDLTSCGRDACVGDPQPAPAWLDPLETGVPPY